MSLGPLQDIRTAQDDYDAMLDWLREKGAEIDDSLILKPSERGGGYGAFVTRDVAENTLLFSISRDACVTLSDATEDEACGEGFRALLEKAGPGGNTVALAGFLAKEYLKTMEDVKKGRKTKTTFGPYLRTLPWIRGVNSQEHILFWTEDDVSSKLSGSMCFAEAKALQAEVSLAIRVTSRIVTKTVKEYRGEVVESGFWPWEKQADKDEILEGLPEATKGAFVCLLTRAFEDGEDEEKLVPMLDMLQHSDEPSIAHAMRQSDGAVEVRARRDIKAGEELLNQYRSELEETMPYHRFFTRFGFVPGIQESIINLLDDKSSIFFAQKAEV